MAEHTPDTEEVAFFYEGQDMDAGERRAGFERWLAAHDRAVKAEALREAASTMNADYEARVMPGSYLLERAAQIEGGTQ